MNAFYRWLPDGPNLPSHHEDHARSKILESYPDAHFEPQAATSGGMHVTLAWSDRMAHDQKTAPVAEILWAS